MPERSKRILSEMRWRLCWRQEFMDLSPYYFTTTTHLHGCMNCSTKTLAIIKVGRKGFTLSFMMMNGLLKRCMAWSVGKQTQHVKCQRVHLK